MTEENLDQKVTIRLTVRQMMILRKAWEVDADNRTYWGGRTPALSRWMAGVLLERACKILDRHADEEAATEEIEGPDDGRDDRCRCGC